MSYLIKNGFMLDEKGEKVQRDIRVEGDAISEIGSLEAASGETVIDADGLFVSPGLVDLHVHFREPGGEKKETIETGAKAAARGGFTTVAAMPNTRPVPDTKEQMEWLVNRIDETASVRVLPYASITIRQTGREMTDFEGLKDAGAFAFTDDGVGVQTAGMMYEAMKKAASINKAIVAHCEDNSLIYGGSVHDGEFAKANGLNGIPSVCEAVHIARDVLLAEAAGCHYHVCHISTKESVRVVRDAKKAGIRVTAEVTPHHLLLSDSDIPGLDTNYKMNPPLRSPEDREALLEGLRDGTIDFIATDHAPHTEEEKQQTMSLAPFGIVGLETAFPLLYTHFVKTGKWTLKQLHDYMTVKPCEAFGLPYGKLEAGRSADITLIDLEREEKIDKSTFLSKGKNTPFDGISCFGWPAMTMAKGKLVYQEGRLVK
ncbi:dihydroorotase [Bacillus licheniformis]|jgi:dihydroorotase|uniref:Dihydroorotase n=4 Tax=Bacillus licheniformis TaxID=1402 RepID=PYRC_BACLD|nr:MULTISPECIES: dihydroorotase [Bacillus]Q65JU9.1 RecName: Full=Dihydroorotase; Short=DHOase [Bacillus licheniformis DSM 13 = ATCC 14580]MBJ7887308.1 dihydroorotase [Bacillaceae bacterium HSR45]MBY8346422.1 dihydroorotase [Bacillus sp. PCH94]MDP4079052.1 dihydroorotase [Bacillota bacterium]AAU23305.1 dihydroorotase [Bacillus licheniformis DSM 13 = ATCC 14580]AAU40665.1 dihydroorotase PyrC [Bacillus licheniformis DSM 13 = ATCC 14580]